MIDFIIVKAAVDRADVCGLLACHAPSDEYDIESERIARIISESDSTERISGICAEVFSRSFSMFKEFSAEKFCEVAEEIVQGLTEKDRG